MDGDIHISGLSVQDPGLPDHQLPSAGVPLIMLVSALAGRGHVLAAYEEAVKERYQFFSFGDAMLIGEI